MSLKLLAVHANGVRSTENRPGDYWTVEDDGSLDIFSAEGPQRIETWAAGCWVHVWTPQTSTQAPKLPTNYLFVNDRTYARVEGRRWTTSYGEGIMSPAAQDALDALYEERNR